MKMPNLQSPYGQYVGKCCPNCHHYWIDDDVEACDLGQQLWDDKYEDDPYGGHENWIDYHNDTCPDWISAYVHRNKQQPTLI